jgi:hypothetical protein
MQLDFAVDRLYSAGWTPAPGDELETLPDGRRFPSVKSITAAFARSRISLVIKHNPKFCCYRASWGPAGQQIDPNSAADQTHGTVVGACEREAAVFAMAQLLAAQADKQTASQLAGV